MNVILPHLLICLGIASFLTMWFKADLPVLLTKLVRRCGYKRRALDFWPDDITYRFWIRSQWSQWLSTTGANSALGRVLAHLLTCPYCLAFHLSWLAGLGVALLRSPTEALACVAYPTVALILYQRT